jgi:HD-GYP domain-containing protein (c-di-GMP phosphodiesterase class II)
VHDLGKIGTPNDVLFKDGKLDSGEWQHMQRHPEVGASILSKYRLFRRGADMVRYHHERYDGHGYPEGKKGKSIPLGARIICVADAFDAMVSDRPYRKGMETGEAIEELKRCSLTQFDPGVVAVMIEILQEEINDGKLVRLEDLQAAMTRVRKSSSPKNEEVRPETKREER